MTSDKNYLDHAELYLMLRNGSWPTLAHTAVDFFNTTHDFTCTRNLYSDDGHDVYEWDIAENAWPGAGIVYQLYLDQEFATHLASDRGTQEVWTWGPEGTFKTIEELWAAIDTDDSRRRPQGWQYPNSRLLALYRVGATQPHFWVINGWQDLASAMRHVAEIVNGDKK